jgi:hypothetical protein
VKILLICLVLRRDRLKLTAQEDVIRITKVAALKKYYFAFSNNRHFLDAEINSA